MSNDIAIIDSARDHDVPVAQDDSDTIQVHEGGLGEDETFGLERDEAVASPVKGKTHLTSTVSYIVFLPGCKPNAFPRLCLGHR
jgi:hypothetical protein